MIQYLRGSTTSIDEATRTVTARWYTGATVQRVDWRTGEKWNLKLSLDDGAVKLGRFNEGAPLLTDHMPFVDTQVGQVERAWVENGAGYATLKFSQRESVTDLWNDVKAGIIKGISMGTAVTKMENVTPKDEKVRTMLAVDWEPFELSIVAVPADAGARIMLSASMGDEDPEMLSEFIEWKKIRAVASQPPPAQPDAIRRNLERERLRFAYVLAK